jgi:hypothetical protein
VEPAPPARHAGPRHARPTGTTHRHQTGKTRTNTQTPKAHGIGTKVL